MYTLREYKYLAPKDRMNEIRKAFMPYLKIDNFLEKEGKSDYYVHSVYFDTEQLNFYSEKLAGVEIRKKLRVRAYNSLTDDSVVFLEVKQKEGDKIKKNRAPLHYNRLKNFLSYGNIETDLLYGDQYPNARNDARKFLYYYYGQNLMPVVLIVYNREAYYCKFNPNLRITFDKNIRSKVCSTTDELFSDYLTSYELQDYFILEVKFNFGYPRWLDAVVQRFGLQHQTMSKYTLCIDSHKSELEMYHRRTFYESAKEFYTKNEKISKAVGNNV